MLALPALHSTNTRPTRVHAIAAALVLALALACTALPVRTYAETRMSDLVLGQTAENRGISASELPDIQARNAIVVAQDGTVYYERDADAEVKIASITKVMTAILTLENTSGNEELTVDHRAATVGESSADLREGDTLTVAACLKALMIPSGNDAAMALATYVGGKIDPASSDPYATFIEAMNNKAAELGMEHSVFENPHGLDFNGWEGNLHSTARDVATMFAYAMKNEQFRALTSDTDNKITVTGADGAQRTIELIERNTILGQDGNIGGKTGGTYDALQCFVGAFTRETGGEIYTVTLGSDGDEQRWADTRAVANWYYEHFAAVPLANTQVKIGDTLILGEAVCADWTDKTVGATLEDVNAQVTVFSLAGDLEQELELDTLTGNIERGQKIGTLTLKQGDETVAQADLVSAETVDAPNPFEWVMVQFDRVVRFFQGEPSTAEAEVYAEAPDALSYDAWGSAA